MKNVKKVNTCTIVTKNRGIVCGNKCAGPACGSHVAEWKRLNPSPEEMLIATDGPDTVAMLQILDKLRSPEGLILLNQAFVDMLALRMRFPPAKNPNRFATGNSAEDLTTDLINALEGCLAVNVADIKTVIDIEVYVKIDEMLHKLGLSVKSSGSIHSQPILENYRGESKSDIRNLPPTLIMYTEVIAKRARLVYLDHDILVSAFPGLTPAEFNAKVYNKKADGDSQASLSFRSGLLANLIPRLPESYIVNGTFPTKIPKVKEMSISRLVLEDLRRAMAESTEMVEPGGAAEDEA
jgi:hypothetical protein